MCMCDKIFALYDRIKIDTAMCWGDLELVKVLGWVGVHQNVLLVSHYIFYEYVVEKESFYFIYRRAGPCPSQTKLLIFLEPFLKEIIIKVFD